MATASTLRRSLLALALLRPWTGWSAPADSGTERKVALVIGNAGYRVGALKNPVNDARAVADALNALKYQVLLRVNATLPDMIEAMRHFSQQTDDAAVRLIFYAGHGLQVKGRNYLLPVDTEIRSEEEVATKSADLNELLERLNRLNQGTSVIILDACRTNPFSGGEILGPDGRRLRFRGTRPLGTAPGLAPVQASPGMLVAFSTAPGGVALDNPSDLNSLYTRALLRHLRSPGLPIEFLFKQVRVDVARETARVQVPWESSNLTAPFCFEPLPSGGCTR